MGMFILGILFFLIAFMVDHSRQAWRARKIIAINYLVAIICMGLALGLPSGNHTVETQVEALGYYDDTGVVLVDDDSIFYSLEANSSRRLCATEKENVQWEMVDSPKMVLEKATYIPRATFFSLGLEENHTVYTFYIPAEGVKTLN